MANDRTAGIPGRQTSLARSSSPVAGAPPATLAAAQEVGRTSGAEGGGFRFVFMPDIHLRRDEGGAEGFARALQVANELDPRPEFILTGGDLVHDLHKLGKAEAQNMIDLFKQIWADNTDLPGHHMLGNHDFAGLMHDSFSEDNPLYGHALFWEALDIPGRHYSFNHGGWHFVVLTNFHVEDGDFVAEFDDEQMEFLRNDLAEARHRPTVIAGHFPAVTAADFFDGDAEQGDEAWRLGYGRAAKNPMALIEAIGDANVAAIFSGHIHRLDQIEVRGQTFICAGSVSGDKWRGPDGATPRGISIVDCHEDGQLSFEYRTYGGGEE